MCKLFLVITIVFMGLCSNAQNNKNVYDVSDYTLVRTDSSSRGLERKFYVYKYDPARKMMEDYYYDGEILGRSFIYNGKLEGALSIFGVKGNTIGIDSFHNGIKVSSKLFTSIDTTTKFFRNGKLEPVTSDDIDYLLKHSSNH